MRTIKFRGKRVDNGEWVYGYLVEIQDLRFAIKDTVYNVNNGRIDIIPSEVNPSTIGQFTGLQDKNGNDIYEGDLIKATWETASTGGYFQSSDAFISHEINVIVFWYNTGFNYKTPFGKMTSIKAGAHLEIIGNIHDNPELLNQSK